MIQDDDQLLQALAFLPPIPRDIQRESRVRARCHLTIAARAARVQRRKRPAAASIAWLAAAAVLCVYLAVMFSAAAQLGRSL
jgi:hypothetical protein